MSTWKELLSSYRRKKNKNEDSPGKSIEKRTFGERDYDRILFSTPVRRLADKTQVFPLEKHDSVRTRLTHSHEVSNLARSIGTSLVFEAKIAGDIENAHRNIPSILAAAGLAHDLGNPPFGHQGEEAIRSWFKRNQSRFSNDRALAEDHFSDFLFFEGNAQTLRLVTRLQLLDSEYGLDLSAGTLASLMKYTVSSSSLTKEMPTRNAASKKNGYFESEKNIALNILNKVGLAPGLRHPLAYIMEACDDIAYSVLDVEDAVKKSIISFHDVINHLKNEKDRLIDSVVVVGEEKFKKYRESNTGLSPSELGDISMQRLRVAAIEVMVDAVHKTFKENEAAILNGSFEKPLIEVSEAKTIVKSLKKLGSERAYRHRSVLEIELSGYNILQELMDMIWFGIVNRTQYEDRDMRRETPFGRYVYGRISENYRRVFTDKSDGLPTAYKEAQLLTDMVAGMTDGFAIQLHKELKSFEGKDFKEFMEQHSG